jgi:hypothetical protein
MFRGIGLILLVMCACALLQGETLFAGIVNGTFQGYDPDNPATSWEPWRSSQDVIGERVFPNPFGTTGALMQGNQSTGLTDLYQDFHVDPLYGTLQFDLRFDFGPSFETEHFTACLLPSNQGPNWTETNQDGTPKANSSFIPTNAIYYYTMNTVLDSGGKPQEDFSTSGVRVLDDFSFDGTYIVGNNIEWNYSTRRIQFSVTPNSDMRIWFGLTEWDPQIDATAIIDNVTVVPEPATMTLGLIGVGIVGAARRKNRSTKS